LPAGDYPREAPPDLALLVERVAPHPAYLLGPRTDVLAWNRAATAMLGEPTRAPDGRQNLLWWLFTTDELRNEQRQATARSTLARFRRKGIICEDCRRSRSSRRRVGGRRAALGGARCGELELPKRRGDAGRKRAGGPTGEGLGDEDRRFGQLTVLARGGPRADRTAGAARVRATTRLAHAARRATGRLS